VSKKEKKHWKRFRQEVKHGKLKENTEFNFGNNVEKEKKETPLMNEVNLNEIVLSVINKGDIKVEVDATILIPVKIYNRMMTYVKLIDKEINGMGMVEKVGLAEFRITDIYLLKQTVSGGSCDIEPDSIRMLAEKLVEEDRNPSMLRFWWHSHNNMGTFFSVTDENTGKQFGGSEYFISIVVNKDGKMRGKINLFKPIELVLDNVAITVEYPPENSNLVEECKKDIEENVKTNVYVPKKGFHSCNNTKIRNTSLINKDLQATENGPFGPQFVEGSVRFVWDKNTVKYKGYCIHTQLELTEDEMITRSGLDYNNPYWLDLAIRNIAQSA